MLLGSKALLVTWDSHYIETDQSQKQGWSREEKENHLVIEIEKEVVEKEQVITKQTIQG